MARGKRKGVPAGAPLSPARQWASIRAAVPDARMLVLTSSRLRAEVVLRPTHLSCSYRIEVDYRLGGSPKVRVQEPALRSRDGEPPPHRYEDGSLCLYRGRYGEWDPARPIGQTVIPWTVLWLSFYELWLVTGVWHGQGEHPEAT